MVDLLPNYAATVRASPGKPCVAEGTWRLTYAEVDALSDNIAHDLQKAGASVGDVVCFVGGAGARRLIFLLACLKAGYCFSSPILQMGETQIVEFSDIIQPKTIIVEDGYEDLAGKMTADTVIPYTTDTRDHGRPATRDLPLETASFISFTSGSTGKPKGMRRNRASLQYFISRGIGLQTLTPDDTAALLGNLWCPTILTGFAAGASLVCYDTPRLGGAGLADWLIAEQATTTMIYPAIFREIMASERYLPDLRAIILIGEPTTRADAEAHARCAAPDAWLVNVFGTMEFAYIAAFKRRARDPIDFDLIPLGFAEDKGVLHLITDDGRQAVDGEVGEIQIVSPHVIAGYLGGEEKDTGKFGVTEDGATMMMTGDLAHRDYKGVYHTAGRRDGQTKIRGYNVRPSEIEIVIKHLPRVKDATVGSFQTASGIARLACHYIGDADPKDLRAALTGKLPGYMIPGLWMRVDAFPRTGTGKVRRLDLPDPFTIAAEVRVSETLTAEEAIVRGVFEETLGQTGFRKDDDFFDLGGDSLQAMHLIISLEKRFGRRLPLDGFIMDGASIAAIAARLMAEDTPSHVVLREGAGDQTLVLTYCVDGDLSPFMELVHQLDRGLRIIGAHAPPASARLLHYPAMAEEFLGRLGPVAGDPSRMTVMGFSFGAPLALEVTRRIGERAGIAPDLIMLDPLLMWRGWRDHAANFRYRLKAGNIAGALRSARGSLDSIHLTRPRTLSDRHTMVFNRYSPDPLTRGRVLYVQGAGGFAARSSERWKARLPASLDTHQIDAAHSDILTGDHVGPLAQTIQAWMQDKE